MKITRRIALGGLAAAAIIRPASAADEVTYLFPAPSILPAFIPHQLARIRGYFTANKLSVKFQNARGGADVAKQVGVGNGDLGGGIGETSMIVRQNGVLVRGVALLGSKSLFRIVTRKELKVTSIADLRGKKIGVTSYEDTSFYALLGALAGSGLKRSDLEIKAVGPAGMTQLMISKSLDGTMTTPEWAYAVETAGIPLDYFSVDQAFPAMTQAILASDKTIKERPEIVRAFVRSVMQALRDCIADPKAAARDFVAGIPEHSGKGDAIEHILRLYVDSVYKTEPASALGTFDPGRMKVVQEFYLENNIIRSASPVADLYTNEFVIG